MNQTFCEVVYDGIHRFQKPKGKELGEKWGPGGVCAAEVGSWRGILHQCGGTTERRDTCGSCEGAELEAGCGLPVYSLQVRF